MRTRNIHDGLEISRRSDEIAMGNPKSIYSFSYHVFSDATVILGNW